MSDALRHIHNQPGADVGGIQPDEGAALTLEKIVHFVDVTVSPGVRPAHGKRGGPHCDARAAGGYRVHFERD